MPDASVHRLDVREADTWVDLLRGVDVVCHQSAMVGAGVTVSDMPLYASHNDLGTAVLLAAMEEAGVKRLVFASSMVVYGEGRYVCATHGHVLPGVRTVADLDAGRFDNPCPTCGQALGWELVDEDARLDPRSSYAASKLATEHYASAWVRQADARAVGLRYHNVYGARMPRDTPYSGVAAIFRSSLERGESPRVFEDGGQMRDFVHVTDVARANLASIEAVADDRLAPYEALNVCSGEPVSIRDVAQMLGAASGIDPVVTGAVPVGRRASRGRLARASAAASWASARRSAPSRAWPPSCTSRCAPERDRRRVPGGAQQVLDDQRRGELDPHAAAAPALRQQRAAEQHPRHERQPDPLHLGLAHLRQVGRRAR